jgi:beta-galactosidase
MDFPRELNDRILFGAAFYDEYRVTGSLERDLDLMVEAGFSVIRVGESVWSTWEPSPGEFDLDWLLPVLDGAHARGIRVILGTPTYAIPPWLQIAHPEIAAEEATGRRIGWGGRQEIDYLSQAFRFHAERVIRAVVGRYGSHPSIIGFQVDNEPGLYLLHNDDAFAGFLGYLRETYGSIEELNRQWGLTYWSHRLTGWDELWRPDGNSSPQYQLEWRRYQAKIVTDFISWQADIVREYALSSQFVTTCISYERPAVDDVALVNSLGVTAGNPYYKMQDGLRIGVEVPRADIWWSSGVWGLFEQGDRMFSSAQAPFLVTETNAQSIGQSQWENHPPYPGQIALAAFALISRGARMIEYWQWQTLHSGIETYWGGVLPHSGKPGRIYREVSELGARIRMLEPQLVGYRPDADVTFLYSTDTKRSFEFYPPLAQESGEPDRTSYIRIFDSFYRGAFESGSQARIVHPEQFTAADLDEFVAENPVLAVPSLYVADDEVLRSLVEFARRGGHLILGVRSGYADELARARVEVAPGVLGEAAGITYDEYTNLDHPVGVSGAVSGFEQTNALAWADRIELVAAEALATYESGIYAGCPAITTNSFGAGRVTYVGTVPDRELARALFDWIVPRPASSDWEFSPTVTIASGKTNSSRVWFVSNWSPEPAWARPSRSSESAGAAVSAGETVTLEPWGLRIFVDAMDQTVIDDVRVADSAR